MAGLKRQKIFPITRSREAYLFHKMIKQNPLKPAHSEKRIVDQKV